ncbi:MAG: hypothetical protein ACI8RU_000896 [Zhongshania aliphaticivorans]|jgi:hypothetical protein|uniref:hypothetical protein n=1 Tax=Zhongshania aliphaticivorans TaxID=1470434 RepID=UPI0039E41363
MLGTVLLIGMIVLGYFHITPWVLIPGAIVASFLGLHYPPGKAEMIKQRGIYWQSFMSSLPLQAALVAALFGVGWGVGALFK